MSWNDMDWDLSPWTEVPWTEAHQLSLSMTTVETIALTWWAFVRKVMSPLFNMLSRLVIVFLPRSKHLLISWLQWFWSPRKESLSLLPLFPHIFAWSDGNKCHDLRMLSFKPTFSVTSFTYIKKLFNSSSLSAIRVVSSAYLRLLIFLSAILTPGCASSNLAFHMMYSAYKLNK